MDLFRKTIVIDKTKNGSKLGLPIGKTVMSVLVKRYRLKHPDSDYVFHNGDGKRFCTRTVQRNFERACKAASVHNFRWHDLRHDFASQLVQAGVRLEVVKELLGHKDIRMTLRYAHLATHNLKSAIGVLDQVSYNTATLTVLEGKKAA